MPEQPNVIFCQCVYSEGLFSDVKQAVLEGLNQAGVVFEAVPDLCKLSANKALCLKNWTKHNKLTVIGCFPRTIKWLFHAGDAAFSPDFELTCLNMHTQSPEAIVQAVLGQSPEITTVKAVPAIKKDGDWVPWFPVIDYDRCQTCKLCMNFCLFGVYDMTDDGHVCVKEPANCKTNCPACARVCPHQAIIFPKYPDAPFNGAEPDPNQTPQNVSHACLNDLLTGNMHNVLKQRSSRKRFSTEPRPDTDTLSTLHKELDIPLSVLQSLSPSDLSRIRQKSSLANKESVND